MSERGGLLFLRAATSVHAGAGPSVGAVDLPLQRERHTGWPMIQASGVKGALRDLHRQHLVAKKEANGQGEADDHEEVQRIYGSRHTEKPGALAVSDARLLALPVRSAAGVFAWATCPAAVGRLAEDLALAGLETETPLEFRDAPEGGVAWVPDPAATPFAAVTEGRVRPALFEELALRLEASEATGKLAEWMATRLFGLESGKPAGFFDPRRRLVAVDDDAFTLFAWTAMEIATRVALDPASKTVAQGPFVEELLPPETLLYSPLLDLESRPGAASGGASSLLDEVAAALGTAKHLLQVGGDETIGKGWMRATLVRGKH
ncbi:MAG: type III-B CRISPR module RAMP protein Cmr4 [Thermoanaerobaculia bacterium]|nr:type III-B CRISPR module RAMP protein Cmr4 [Thermoanaerobaculia bacterium]